MTNGGIEGVPMEQLLQELPLEDSNLVPLNVLVERLSNLAYQTIQSLADTLPSLTSHAKRAKIFSTAIELRKIFVKLLVIVRWSKDVEMLNRARNVVGLLVEQQWAHEDVFSGLTQVRKILPNARIFDADLVTAIDVLRTGTYKRLPKAIKDSTVPQEPMSDSEALDVMLQLDKVLQERLACAELAPLGLYLSKIESGKAYFEAPGLYNICLTTSGPADDDRWWLLEFSFKDQVADSEKLDSILTEPYLDHIYSTSDSILGQTTTSDDHRLALTRLHEFLEQESLQRQLHIIHHQLENMSRFNWGSHIRYVLNTESRSLEIFYWTSQSVGATKKTEKSLLQGHLTLALKTKERIGKDKIVSEILSGSDVITQSSSIEVKWSTDDRIQSYLTPEERNIQLVNLDAKELVLFTIQRHSMALLKFFQEQISSHSGLSAGSSTICTLRMHAGCKYEPRNLLQLHITESVKIIFFVSVISGRLGLKMLEDIEGVNGLALSLSQSHDVSLLRLADQLNANISQVTELLFSYRLQCLRTDVQAQASWLGLPYLTSVMLGPGELKKLGISDGHPLLFLPLFVMSGYYLMLYFVPGRPLSMALVSIMTQNDEGKSMQTINSVKWLDNDQLSQYSVTGADLVHVPKRNAPEASITTSRYEGIQSKELELALHYCVATVVYSHLEEQFRLKLIPFVLVGATTDISAPPEASIDPLLPGLCIHAKELLGSCADLASPNISLQICDWWLPAQRRVEISMKLKLSVALDEGDIQLFEGALLNLSTGVLRFTCKDLTMVLDTLYKYWDQAARMCLLINSISKHSEERMSLSLKSVGYEHIRFLYEPTNKETQKARLSATVTFNGPNQLHHQRFCLDFGVESNDDGNETHGRNPHSLVATVLGRFLNSMAKEKMDMWLSLFEVCCDANSQILEVTLPVLQILEPLYYEALTNPACPDVEIRNHDWFKLNFSESRGLDVRILSHDRIMLTDLSKETYQMKQQEGRKASKTKDLRTVWTQLQQQFSLHLPNKPRRGASRSDTEPPHQPNQTVIFLTKENQKYLSKIIDELK